MADLKQIQLVSDAVGNAVSVIVPIDLWREISSERETASLLSSPNMKRRLLEAMARTDGVSLKQARSQLGMGRGLGCWQETK